MKPLMLSLIFLCGDYEGGSLCVPGRELRTPPGRSPIAIMIDASASMLAPKVVNVIRLRNQSSDRQRAARKWVQALDTVDWLTAQLPTGSRYQIILFNTEARFALPETQGRWLEVANSDQVERVITSVRDTLPSGGTSLYNAFAFLNELDSKPDNVKHCDR